MIISALCTALLLLLTGASGTNPKSGHPASIQRIASMGVARAAHSVTTLNDGRVLVVGGFTAPQSAVGAELFDATRARFEPAGAMQVVRHSHTATRLRDGRVLIVGGYASGNEPTSQAEIYDPATNHFARTGALQIARAGHVAVLLQDGTVLIAGGVGTGWSFLSSAEHYDPATGRFTSTGAMQVPRESHVGVALPNGRVLVVGGHQGRREGRRLYTSAEEYDPARGTFALVGDMHTRRHKHDAVLLADGSVLVTGGSDEADDRGAYRHAERYDPRTQRFTRVAATMHHARYKHAGSSVLLPDGRVLIAGGAPQAEVFDPVRGTFETVTSRSPLAGNFPASALLPDGTVLITGGYGINMGPQAAAWRFTP